MIFNVQLMLHDFYNKLYLIIFNKIIHNATLNS